MATELDLFADTMVSVPQPVRTVPLPKFRASAVCNSMGDGKYDLRLRSGAFAADLFERDSVYIQGDRNAINVKLIPPKSEHARSQAAVFETTANMTGIEGYQVEVYVKEPCDLFRREDWSEGNVISYLQATAKIQELLSRTDPLSVIVTALNTLDYTAEAWQELATSPTPAPKTAGDGSILTPEVVQEQANIWREAQEAARPLAQFALERGLAAPIDKPQFEALQRAQRQICIRAALNMDNVRALERMSENQIKGMWELIEENINAGIDAPALPLGVEPEEKPSNEGNQKKKPIRGNQSSTTSSKSNESSTSSSPVESTPSPSADSSENENSSLSTTQSSESDTEEI